MSNLNPFYVKHPQSSIYGPVTMDEDFHSLTPDIRDFLKSNGIAAFSNGFLMTPGSGIWSEFIRRKAPGSEDPVAFLRTAFGGIFYLDRGEIRFFNPVDESVQNHEDAGNFQLIMNFFLCDRNILANLYLYPLFLQALDTLGEIQPDEYYKFVVPPKDGGLPVVENLTKAIFEI